MYFTEKGESLPELMSHVKQKYGDQVQILEKNTFPKRGISGMFGNQTYEVRGMCPDGHADTKRSRSPSRSPSPSPALRAAIDEIRSQEMRVDTTDSTHQLARLHKKVDVLLRKQREQVGDAYPELRQIERLLIENDFSYSCTQELVQRARRFFTIEQIRQPKKCHAQMMQWIAEYISVAPWDQVHDTRIHILIGPTGVGKTTTLAKIAKLLAFGTGTTKIADIGLFTVDNYRLAAQEQLDGYGRSMGTAVKLIRSAEELTSALAVHARDRHILIDTIGRSPHESVSLGGMNQLLQTCGKEAKCSLVISATTKDSDLALIKKQYHPFDFHSIIVTKLDETDSIGNIISSFAHDSVPFVYYTHGQKVPLDIRDASKEALLRKIFGFNINTEALSKR